MRRKEEGRLKVSATLPEDLVAWLDRKIVDREFHNYSHALEVAVLELKKNHKGK